MKFHPKISFVYVTIILVALAGCGSSNPEAPVQNIHNLHYVDMDSPDYTTQRPLIVDSTYPGGVEMVLAPNNELNNEIHTVFPPNIIPPNKQNTKFPISISGKFLKTNPNNATGNILRKNIPNDYSYFLVSSWSTTN